MNDQTQRTGQATSRIVEVQPYIFFGGRCEKALKFYREKLRAEVSCMMRFFATRFGMVVDRFGICWMVPVPKDKDGMSES